LWCFLFFGGGGGVGGGGGGGGLGSNIPLEVVLCCFVDVLFHSDISI